MKPVWLIARTVLLEAIRRKEIYAIVLVSVLLLGAVMTVDFFGIKGLTKFYREVALKLMSTATAFTVVILAARQLPREFENRTIHPLLARPIGRATFLLGKLLGVLLAAGFCFGLFMSVFVAGSFYLEATVPGVLFAQYIFLHHCRRYFLSNRGNIHLGRALPLSLLGHRRADRHSCIDLAHPAADPV
jgi:ABC-type transport system involved in multi-copper enzyme maturation permease subunit